MMQKLAFTAAMLMTGAVYAQTPAPNAMAPAPTTTPAAPAQTAPNPADTGPGKMAEPASGMKSVDLSAADKSFVEKAASGGMAEVQAAQLAQQKGDDQKVKDFAQTMITDHTAANQQLTTLAQQKGVTISTTLSSKDQSELDKLGKLDGKKFDRTYMKAETKDHKEMLALLEKEAKHGKDADLKSFAEQTIPTIKKHLEMAESSK
jgi:putative membrane protein